MLFARISLQCLILSIGTPSVAQPIFNGTLIEEWCRMDAINYCKGDFCEGAEGIFNTEVKIDFLKMKVSENDGLQERSLEIVATSKAEVGKPLWVKFTTNRGELAERFVLFLIPDGSGEFDKTLTAVKESKDKNGTSIVSGNCGPIKIN